MLLPTKFPGGREQNRPVVPYLRPVATSVARPPRHGPTSPSPCRLESKEVPFAELLLSSLIPFSLCLSLPHLISSEPDETLAPPLAVDADAVSHPGRIESHRRFRLEVLSRLAKLRGLGPRRLAGIVILLPRHRTGLFSDSGAVELSPTSPTTPADRKSVV